MLQIYGKEKEQYLLDRSLFQDLGWNFEAAATSYWVDDGEIVALMDVDSWGSGIIGMFEVRRDRRNQGIGSRIIQKMKEDRPDLSRSGSGNTAVRFWRKMEL